MSVGHKAQESKVRGDAVTGPCDPAATGTGEGREGAGIETVDFHVFVLHSQINHLIMSYLIWNKIYSLKNSMKKT